MVSFKLLITEYVVCATYSFCRKRGFYMSVNPIHNPDILKYIESLIPEKKGYIKEMEEYAEEHGVPIIQKDGARLLEVMTRIKQPRTILEIGTAIGYSGALMLANTREDAVLHTIELNQEMHDIAISNFKILGLDQRTKVYLGDGREVVEEIDETFDLIFIDAAKGHYQKFFELYFHKLNPGGMILSDNVLFYGMVAHRKYLIRRKRTIAKRMKAYLAFLKENKDMDTCVLPVGDGMAISIRKDKEECQK